MAGIAALLACVLLTAVGVAALRTDTASADTRLTGGEAVFELPDGTSTEAAEGDRVPLGATVRAGRTGAELSTRDREVHLGADTAVTVLDGVRQVLRAGFVMVDASDAPGVELAGAAATVTTQDDSLVRVDAGPLLRVGVLRGDAASVRAAGRRATTEVPTYYQVQVPNGGLPGPTTPLVLTGDAYEQKLAADLVTADEDLNALASRLDSGGTGRVVLAALRSDVPAVATEAGGSESTLGYLIATAAEGESLGDRYAMVRGLRADGGSWGVVAAIVSAEVREVSAALSELLGPGTAPALATGPLDVNAVLGFGSAAAPGAGGDDTSTTDPSRPTGPSGPGTDGEQPPSGGGSEPPPSSPPRPTDPVTDPLPDPVEEPVEDVIGTVLDIISSPTPAPALPKLPVTSPVTAPVPAPSPVSVPLPVPLPSLPPLLK